MGWEAWVTLATVGLMIYALIRDFAPADLVLLGGLTVVMTAGAFATPGSFPSVSEAVAGFGNKGPVTVGVLYVVTAGLRHTGAMSMLVEPLLGRPRTATGAQARLMGPVLVLSAFLNNTPVVAMFMPVVSDWCKKIRVSPSKLFIPLSYMAIFGGVCTLIGTSTNLVVNGLVQADPSLNMPQGLGMFDITVLGVTVTVVGMLYILVASPWLLPNRVPAISTTDDPRRYSVEAIVDPTGPLVGQTIEKAGLRHLPGLYLIEIGRGDDVIAAPGPEQRLQAGDRLVFVGVVDSIIDLKKMRGLLAATDQVFKLDAPPTKRTLIEAVVSDSCPLVGKTIRDGRFRTVYNAAVIAVARNGQRLPGKIGDIVLRAGDTLLVEADASFLDKQRHSRDFFLVSRVEDSAPIRHHLSWLALGTLAAMVIVVTAGWLSILPAAMLAAGLMILTRCCSGNEARRSIDWSVLLSIGAALGIGKALETTGAAHGIATRLIGLATAQPWLVLLMVYLVTSIFTELITNNAAAVLVFPIAKAAALGLNVSFLPFIFSIMVGASASFSTPIGYQTNLMVYGPGGYRFTDYLRIGLPLNLLTMAVTVTLAPLIWPF